MSDGRRTYLQCDYGQIHARVWGAGDPVVLLHWTPGSGAMLAHIGAALAEEGFEAWALDMLGFGRSDRPPAAEGWTQARHGGAIADALSGAGLGGVTLCGGHMGAEVALEASLARPGLAARLVLDGVASDWNPETRAQMIAAGGYQAPAYDADGAPLHWAWDRTMWIWSAWRPGLEVDAETAPVLHQAVIDLMETGFDIRPMGEAFSAYPARERLALANAPCLALTADSDTLRSHFPTTVRALPDAKGHVFPGLHPAHRPSGGPGYARVLAAFIRGEPMDWLTAEDDLAPSDAAGASYSST